MDKTEYLKMKQLDRIEYGLIYDRIKEKYSIDFLFWLPWILVIVNFLTLNLGLLYYQIFKSAVIILMLRYVLFYEFFILILAVIAGVLLTYVSHKKINELDERFLKK